MVKLAEVGERLLIEEFYKVIEKAEWFLTSYPDDAIVIEIERGRIAISCDMLVWDTDVPEGMSFKQAGRKAVISCISDLVSKGARPLAVLTSLGLPRSLGLSEALDLMKGLNDGAREYGAYIVGGDTNEAPTIIVDVAGLGRVEGSLMSRSGARPGDFLAITGSFGATGAGLIMYQHKLIPKDSQLKERLWKTLTMPKARMKEGLALSSTGVVTASIDSSDGLAGSLSELSKASGVGFIVEEVPIDECANAYAEEFNLDPLELALYGGEEYELVVTIRPEGLRKAIEAVERVGGELIKIGRAIPERELKVLTTKGLKPIEPKGWEHLKKR